MRIFGEERLIHKELLTGMIVILLVISSLVYIVHLLFTGEKRFLQEELRKQVTSCVGYLNELESMKPDGRARGHSFNSGKHELYILIEEEEYTFKIDSSDFMEMYRRVACDLNLRDPMTLAALDSVVKSRLNEYTRNIPVVFRRVDSLGNTKEVFPADNTMYMDMEEAGSVRLGYISGEEIKVFWDYSWKDFYKKFWWQVLGVAAVGSLVIMLVISFVMQVRKYRKMKNLQERAFRQRMHDLKNPVAAIESTLYNLHLKNPEWFRNENGRDKYDACMNILVMLKEDIKDVLGMATMLYRKRVEWENINLREELVQLVDVFQCANKGKKEVKITVDYVLPDSLMLSKQFLYALRNLVDNAVKYSDNMANVTIACYIEGKEIVVSVADKGKGIDKKDIPYIFEEFWRVGKEKKTEGYGLGLASVKKIVKRHGGKIIVESEPGIGSKFTIKIQYHGREDKAFIRGRRPVNPGKLCGNIVNQGV